MPANIQTTITLARAFGAQLQSELTARNMRDAIYRNKCSDNDSVCHSHDFCDANMSMDAAFNETLGRSPDLDSDDDVALWNDAWAVAKAADFFI